MHKPRDFGLFDINQRDFRPRSQKISGIRDDDGRGLGIRSSGVRQFSSRIGAGGTNNRADFRA